MSKTTRCLICNESSESNVCEDCSSRKGCKVCNEMKMDFFSYKIGKLYRTCKECFNKKVRCEFCNKELNKSYLRSHIEKQPLYPRVPTQGYSQGYPHSFARFPHRFPRRFPRRFLRRFPPIIIIIMMMIINVIEH